MKQKEFKLDLNYSTILELSNALDTKKVSCTELLSNVLERISNLEPTINSFAFLDEGSALVQAKESERRQMSGKRLSHLDGIPTSVKDLISVKGMPQRFGSKSTSNELKKEDAPSVDRLRKAGAIFIGKSTTSEFGCKAVGDSPLTGFTRNPWSVENTAGGSSGGAAAMVSAGIVPYAIGTDGGGSIRIPASLCGIFGIKAQFGRVPVFPYSATPTLAHVGPLSRRVKDSALILETISGFDPRDPYSLKEKTPGFVKATKKQSQFKIAYSHSMGFAKPEKEVSLLVDESVKRLEDYGHSVDLVENVMKDPQEMWASEFYAGVGAKLSKVIADNPHLLDPAIRVILEQNFLKSVAEYYSKVFERLEFREKLRTFFTKYDLLVTPTLPVSGVEIGLNVPKEYDKNALVTWVKYTYPFNLTGQPAASIPIGFSRSGQPVGLQVVARTRREDSIFDLCQQLENIMSIYSRQPNIGKY